MELEDNIEDFTENIIAELVEELEDVINDTRGNWYDMLSYVKYKEENHRALGSTR